MRAKRVKKSVREEYFLIIEKCVFDLINAFYS